MAECPIDGGKIGFMGGVTLKDGEICNDCAKKVGFEKGIAKSEMAAHSYTINEIRDLITKGEKYDPDHASHVREESVKRAASGIDISQPVDPEFEKKYFDKFDLNDLEPGTKKAVENALGKMSAMGYARVASSLNGVLERYQVTMNQTQIEQNWILIKQQDETNKLLKQLLIRK